MTDPVFREWASQGLIWLPHRGMGYLPVTESPYDGSYWAKYEAYARTDMGRAITQARLRLTDQYARHGSLVDIGIGCGSYVEARGGATYGYDINPVAVEWLRARQRWLDPYEQTVLSATFWDAIEHIPDVARILVNVQRWVFVTVPIVPGNDPPSESWRHYRKDEHCWYWTRDGFISWMGGHGFACVEHNTMESLLGREDSHTFVFERCAP